MKAVIFDLDGTLLDTYEDLADAVNFALRKKGFSEWEAEKYKIFVGNGTDMMIRRALPENSRDDKTVAELRPLYYEYYNAHSGDKTRPYDGIRELLTELKARGIKLGVVSNKVDFMARTVVKDYFPDTFDYVTGQRDGVPAKPDPTAVFDALTAMGIGRGDCIYVGDSGVDAETGVNAGLFTVGVLWGFRGETELRENGASAIISKPCELLSYV